MSLDRIYSINDPQWQPDPELPDYLPVPPQSVQIAVNGLDEAYLVGDAGFADWDALTSTLVGSWDSQTGEPLSAITSDYKDWIADWGNESGVATAVNDTTRFQGHSEAKYFEYDDTDPEDIQAERYPVADRPFTIKMTREAFGVDADPWDTNVTYNTGDYVTNGGSTWYSLTDGNQGNVPFGGSPNWALESVPGYGWRAELISDNPEVDVVARAIGIYSDPAWSSYLYTSGAFSMDAETGLYTSLCPIGQRTPNPDPIYYAILLGSAKEGTWQLTDEDVGAWQDRYHWTFDS